MSSPSSTSKAVPGTTERRASVSQPVKQGLWGWPRRSQGEVSKPSSGPSGAGSGSSALPSSPPVVSGVESMSPTQPDTAGLKRPSLPPVPKATRVNSEKPAKIPNTETDLTSGDAKWPRPSISAKRPSQPEPPPFHPNGLDSHNNVDALISQDIPNPPNTRSSLPVIDSKSPVRRWPPVSPAQLRTSSLDPINREGLPTSSLRKGSGSTTSTRRSSRNLSPSQIRLPNSPAFGDAGDLESHIALSPPSPRRSLGAEDIDLRQVPRERATSNQALFTSSPFESDRIDDGLVGPVESDRIDDRLAGPVESDRIDDRLAGPVESDRIDDRLAGKLDDHDPRSARTPEVTQKEHEEAEQGPLVQGSLSFSLGHDSIATSPVSKEVQGIKDPWGSTTSLSSTSSILRTPRVGSQNPGEIAARTSDLSDISIQDPQIASRGIERNPSDLGSILDAEDTRQIPAERKLTGGSSLDSSFARKDTQPGQLKRLRPSVPNNVSDINGKALASIALEQAKDDEDLSYPGRHGDDSSSETVTPFEQGDTATEHSVAQELGRPGPNVAPRAFNGITEHSPAVINDARNEETAPFGTGYPSTYHQLLPEPSLAPKNDSAGFVAVSQPVSSDDLVSTRGVKSKDTSKAWSSADESQAEEEAALRASLNPETSLTRVNTRLHGTDQKEELREPATQKVKSEDETSFETVQTHRSQDDVTGKSLNVTIDVQAEVRESGNRRISEDVPELEKVRTVIEIPSTPTTAKRLPIPKIYVQNPSDATEPDVASPICKHSDSSRKSSMSVPRTLHSATQCPERRRSTSVGRLPAFVDSGAAKDQGTTGGHKTPVRKRKLYLRKARNVAARRVILDITLGRELAKQTKPALRRLAKGEHVAFEVSARLG